MNTNVYQTSLSLLTWFSIGAITLGLHLNGAFAQDGRTSKEKSNTLLKTLTGRHGEIQVHKISLSGSAVNEDGEPISGATIIVGYADLNQAIGTDEAGEKHEYPFELARLTTDVQGRFTASELVVPAKKDIGNNPESVPLQAELQLIGIADNYGMTWCQRFAFRPGKRTAKTFADEEGDVYFSGETIDIPLVFPPSVPLHGRLTDHEGNPIADAIVRAGLVNAPRDAPGAEPRSTFLTFTEDSPNAGAGYPRMHLIPEKFRKTKTDAKGEYRFGHIPFAVRIAVSFSHPSFLSHEYTSFNTSPGAKRRKFIGANYELSPEVDLGRTMALTAIDPKTKQAVPGTKFEILYSRAVQQNSVATANEDGIASLRILPGSYTLRIIPPPGNKYCVTTDILNVEEESVGDDPFAWELTPAISVRCKAVAGEDPIAGVAFEYSTDGEIWNAGKTQGSYTEYASTNRDGILNLVVPHDARSIRVRGDEQDLTKKKVSGESELVFNVDPATAIIDARSLAYLDTVSALSGKYQYRSNNHLQKDVSVKDFRDKIASLAGMDAKQIEGQLRAYFGKLPMSEIALVQAGSRRRVETTYTSGETTRTDWTISDGQNQVSFDSSNRQCSVYTEKNSMIFMPGISSIVLLPMDLDPKEVTREGDRLVLKKEQSGQTARVEQDAETGFVHLLESLSGTRGQSKWQFGPREIDGQVLPQVRVDARYRDSKLSYAKVYFLDDIRLDDTIPTETFAMNLPAGTGVFDYRSLAGDAVSRRGKHTAINTDCIDLIARLGEAVPIVPAMKYGDPAPKLQIQNWIQSGRTIDAPDLNGKRLLLFFLGGEHSDFASDLPALRRASVAFEGDDKNIVIAVFSPPQTASSLAKLSIVRDLNCIVAVDSPTGERGHKGKTRAAYPGYSHQVSAVVDPQGKVAMFASYNDNIDSITNSVKRRAK